ncbi:MAG: polyprenyl diphosphate synthase [Candidatus Diapherotrites archaeon]
MQLKSIAFIPDGNRRYAIKAGVSLLESYRMGTEKAWHVLDWLNSYPKIKAGTFYTLSLENLQRNKAELKILFKIFEKELDKVWSTNKFTANQLRLKFIGRTHLLPQKLQNKMRRAEEFTENYRKKVINMALGYNGQAEIIDAAKRLAWDFKHNAISLASLTEKKFKNYLYSAFPDPDLIIRTSGTKRLSGFLTYQSSYSELYFIEKYWPEFSEEDLATAINEFNDRQRRFGK